MKFTFGIVTTKTTCGFIEEVVESIRFNDIPKDNYEIIIIGGDDKTINKDKYKMVPTIDSMTGVLETVKSQDDNISHYQFDEMEKPGWFTRKKNLITKYAKFENIVFLHDYFVFDKNWYNGFLDFGNDWDICMNVIKNLDGSRYRDWCVWSDPDICYDGPPYYGHGKNHSIVLPPYDYNKIQYMYISGGFWITKKYVIQEYPVNEELFYSLQSQGEDLEWSERVLKSGKFSYRMNVNSEVRLLKDKRLVGKYLP